MILNDWEIKKCLFLYENDFDVKRRIISVLQSWYHFLLDFLVGVVPVGKQLYG
jgi:hypothetical protein